MASFRCFEDIFPIGYRESSIDHFRGCAYKKLGASGLRASPAASQAPAFDRSFVFRSWRMDRTTRLLVAGLLLIAAEAVAQQSSPQSPEDAYTSRELIAWSQLQTPQPAPQPLPQREPAVPQPQQPGDQQHQSPADPHTQQEPISSRAPIQSERANPKALLPAPSKFIN